MTYKGWYAVKHKLIHQPPNHLTNQPTNQKKSYFILVLLFL